MFVVISVHPPLVATRKIVEGNNIKFQVSNVAKTDSYYVWANWPCLYCGHTVNHATTSLVPRP